MRFAKIIFSIAGVWGFVIVSSLYFLHDSIGRQYPPPITHPDFYYGFIGITLVWQLGFLIIATDPVRYRPIMIAAMLEKFAYVATLSILFSSGQLQFGQFTVVAPDFLLGVLFVAAFFKTARATTMMQPSDSHQLSL
jgi:hypothetical protein